MPQKREYIKIAEAALGHALPKGCEVHHVDCDPANNRNDNLCIMQSRQEHLALHVRLRVKQRGGDPWTQRICATCRKPTDFALMVTTRGVVQTECKRCAADRVRAKRCARVGRENRNLTAAEYSEVQRKNALRRWGGSQIASF